MKAEWFIETDEGEQVGVIKMEGNWKDPKFRENFLIFVVKMMTNYNDTSEQRKIEEEE